MRVYAQGTAPSPSTAWFPMSRLADQIQQVLPAFSELETPPALIDGLALAAHKVIRATRDVDFLVAAVDADRVHPKFRT
jgi:hypothetical protein